MVSLPFFLSQFQGFRSFFEKNELFSNLFIIVVVFTYEAFSFIL